MFVGVPVNIWTLVPFVRDDWILLSNKLSKFKNIINIYSHLQVYLYPDKLNLGYSFEGQVNANQFFHCWYTPTSH